MNLKNKYKDEYEELLIKISTSTYVDDLGAAIEKKKQELFNTEGYSVSTQGLEEFKNALDKIDKKNKFISLVKKINLSGKKIAAFFGIGVLVFIGSFSTVEAFRVNILNFFITKAEDYTNVNITDTLSTFPSPPTQWQGFYYPHYIPNGFEILKSSINDGVGEIIYTNKNGNKIMYSLNSETQNLFLDTEDVVYRQILINNSSAQIMTKQKYSTIIWENGEHLFTISSDISKQELVKIAESIKK